VELSVTASPLPRSGEPWTAPDRPVAAPARSRPRIDGPFDTIDLAALESSGMIVPDGRRTQISEEFRIIKRTLLQNVKRRESSESTSNLILVTSAFPGEGKTFSSINLAISMSREIDHSVLLVDADVAQVRRADFLGLKPRKGLIDLLVNPSLSLEEAVIRTNVERLDVLLAGPAHHHATELLASDAMTRLLSRLAAQGPERIVIFDGPPLLVTTEAGALAHRAGQVVLVVEAGKTTQAAVKSAMAQLEGCTVFAVLNKSTGGLSEDMHSYGRYGRYKYSE
jgi:receptor protein-tyrosine kinase